MLKYLISSNSHSALHKSSKNLLKHLNIKYIESNDLKPLNYYNARLNLNYTSSVIHNVNIAKVNNAILLCLEEDEYFYLRNAFRILKDEGKLEENYVFEYLPDILLKSNQLKNLKNLSNFTLFLHLGNIFNQNSAYFDILKLLNVKIRYDENSHISFAHLLNIDSAFCNKSSANLYIKMIDNGIDSILSCSESNFNLFDKNAKEFVKIAQITIKPYPILCFAQLILLALGANKESLALDVQNTPITWLNT